ncbi:uncharacterized protein LOC120286521 isoform X1 [Eucalyptus grandis]|uniref:uncharacterized protein LOC120286521 isoform X1 n=1 Tax=Eucalyptus grandis TaxID=71139 RepID=UPI0008A0C8EF|nr:uncharacterized protein LOC120286521 isoform X1 [Eucalyptus grandis]
MAQTMDSMPPAKSSDASPDDADERDDLPSSAKEGAVKWKKRRRRGKRKREDRDRPPPSPPSPSSSSRDPLEVFGADLMVMILNNLDARSVALSLLVSRAWHRVASSDRLWSRKTRITKYDLCDHAWEFHFSKAAPEYWRNLDAYWKGTGPPMHRYFHLDGSQSADPGDKVWGGHECCYSIVTSFIDDGKIREHYVRINRWPHMSVYRKQDWSWEMSNGVFFYASVPDADKLGGTGPLFPVVCGL